MLILDKNTRPISSNSILSHLDTFGLKAIVRQQNRWWKLFDASYKRVSWTDMPFNVIGLAWSAKTKSVCCHTRVTEMDNLCYKVAVQSLPWAQSVIISVFSSSSDRDLSGWRHTALIDEWWAQSFFERSINKLAAMFESMKHNIWPLRTSYFTF